VSADGAGDAVLVAGTIAFARPAHPFARGRAVVRVEDVSRAGAPARPVAEQVLPDVAFGGDDAERLAFAVRGAVPPAGGRYALRVHVDADADGEVGAGDYVTVEHIPVDAFGPEPAREVRVHLVR
jgi:hypothetical protein